jgi:uncharacterized protein (TIGR00369 family)
VARAGRRARAGGGGALTAAAGGADPAGGADALGREAAAFAERGLAAALGIRFVELSPERVVATMPVGPHTHQPFGLLHGGASVALAETVASVGAWLNIDREREAAVGLEINANHLRGKRDGAVTATATPCHRGRSTQVWDVRVHDERGRPVCVSRCTVAVVPRGAAPGAGAPDPGAPNAEPAA